VIDKIAIGLLAVNDSVQGCSGEELSKGDGFMNNVPPCVPLVAIAVTTIIGVMEDVRVASRRRVMDAIRPSKRTPGLENNHVGVYVTLIVVVWTKSVISSA
jgi:hypothetical protein